MTQPVLTTTIQKLVVDDVGGVVLTDIATDTDGQFVRELRVSGVIDSANPQAPLVLTIRLRSDTKANITLSTPAFSF